MSLKDVPLTRAREPGALACPASFVRRRGRVGRGDQALAETVKVVGSLRAPFGSNQGRP
jgi:hypothetical protein